MGNDGTSTRDRLITEGMRLFAERGFRGTTVADIQEAVGLARGSGALYKHFSSKQEVLEAGLEQAIARVESVAGVAGTLDYRELPHALTVLGQRIMESIRQNRDMVRILDEEGDRFPELRDRARKAVERGMRVVGDMLALYLDARGDEGIDVEAYAVLVMGALLSFYRFQWTFGGPALEVDEERVLATWVELELRIVDALSSRK